MTYPFKNQKYSCDALLNENRKRIIRNNEKLKHWKCRNDSRLVHAALSQNQLSCSGCTCDLELDPGEVKKSKSKIKFGNKKYVSSRYHVNCLNKKDKQPKPIKNHIKRNVKTDSCKDCHCALEECPKKQFKNKCYCCYPRNEPMLPGKPEFVDIEKCRYIPTKAHLNAPSKSSTYSLETLKKAKHMLNYVPKSEFLNQMRSQAKVLPSCDCVECKRKDEPEKLQFTDRRMKLEKAYKKYEDSKACEANCMAQYEKSSNSRDLSTNCNDSETTLNDKINSVKNIRQDHYFDTHMTKNFDTHMTKNLAVPSKYDSHHCVFKYTTDSRALLKPLNPDAYGTNRCTVCNKGMQESIIKNAVESPSNVINESSNIYRNNSTENINKIKNYTEIRADEFEEFYKNYQNDDDYKCSEGSTNNKIVSQNYVHEYIQDMQDLKKSSITKQIDNQRKKISDILLPRKISVPSRNEIVELNLPPSFIALPQKFHLNMKMAPSNTWALRFQKGVL